MPEKGSQGHHFLVTEVTTYNLYACVKSMMLLRNVIQKGFPLRLCNVLGHRVSPSMLAPGENGEMYARRGSSLSPQHHIEGLEQVSCQCCV